MNRNGVLVGAAAALALAACSKPEEQARPAPKAAAAPVAPKATDLPAGTYRLDKSHASVNFRIDHLGLSRYTARFTGMDATLELDPKRPQASSVAVTIDARTLQTNYPDAETLDFDAQLTGPDWLDAKRFPEITYRSTAVELTGPDTARITGDLTLHGVARPVVLEAKFNGGYASNAVDPSGSRVGFSAQGTLRRSEFGISAGIPAPGSTFGVGDQIEVLIEAEFTRPRDAGAGGR
jgi:polyisoprenoid-binding protein YceI